MIKQIYEETDSIGKHKVLEQRNGIKVRILREPSKEYADKMAARAEAEAVRRAEEEEKQAIRKKIEDEKERQAREALLASGELTQAEVDKIGG
jgi:hypothetical protein